jgi:hypothetical protein
METFLRSITCVGFVATCEVLETVDAIDAKLQFLQ